VPVVRHDSGARVQMNRIHARALQRRRRDVARKTLAHAQDGVGKPGRQSAGGGGLVHQVVELAEVFADDAMDGAGLLAPQQSPGFPGMEVHQLDQFAAGGGRVSRRAQAPDGQQPVGGLSHRGDNHRGMPVAATAHDRRNTLDSLGGFDGRSAELHNDHGSESLYRAISLGDSSPC